MSKSWIILYSFYLRIHEGEDFLFYLMVVGLDSLFEIIRANFICKYWCPVKTDRKFYKPLFIGNTGTFNQWGLTFCFK